MVEQEGLRPTMTGSLTPGASKTGSFTCVAPPPGSALRVRIRLDGPSRATTYFSGHLD
ncbi:hypothetical protein AB0I28_36560 [Phytomonospora sp. NPDC050363]|uniref:hypothetical protein n=1 Tax=Phytomonospora sp. NPDC050363 TaxID=3155642 RepID=UPI0033EDFDFF